ncbi:MAG: hypothetical protein KF778_21575 [Rhodocyclaceae bacterium]|nr:hypothetical protein [Rhodocyclaceae bacterium]MBX3670995.1 hypothetical protein [Rhodocyclaceae bacterium]
MSQNTSSAQQAAELLRGSFLQQPFGAIRFWRFAVVRPHDQAYTLVSTHADADRLDLAFVHASGQGLPGLISVWQPEGVNVSSRGVTIKTAARVRMDDSEAWTDDGSKYHIRTPRGEGAFDIGEADALTLEI